MKHNFEQRKQNRIEFAQAQAQKNRKKSDDLYQQASKMSAVIPFGQPILVGHHSEKSDRNYRNRIHNTFGEAFEAMDKADYYKNKAESIEANTAIFSDDPEALQKLKEKLISLQSSQDFMKAANKCIRSKDKETFLKLPHATEALWDEVNKVGVMGSKGFAGFELRNNNANIVRIKNRIASLEKFVDQPASEFEINGVRLVSNTKANRVQLFFNDIPSPEIRKRLKQSGFRWCRSEQAWQRHLTLLSINIAKQILQNL